MSQESNNGALNNDEDNLQEKGFFKNMRSDKIYRRKFAITLCCCWSYGMYGWNSTQISTALPELQQILNIDLETISWIYTTVCIGTIFSGFVFGFLYDRFDRFTIMALCLIGGGILHGMLPLSTSFPATLMLRLVIGFCFGGIETGMVTIVSTVWSTDESSFIHASYLSFFIGGFIGPLVTTPFMSNDFQDAQNSFQRQPNEANLTQSHLNNTSSTIKRVSTVTPLSLTSDADGVSRIYLAFIITGVVTIVASFPFIYMFKSKTYRNFRLIPRSSMSTTIQGSNATVGQTDSDGQHVSRTKRESTKEPGVEIMKTKETVLEIKKDSLNKVSDNAGVDFNTIENLSISKICDITSLSKVKHLKNLHNKEKHNIAIVREQPNQLMEHKILNSLNSVHITITNPDPTHISSTLEPRDTTNTDQNSRDSKHLNCQSSVNDITNTSSDRNQEYSKSKTVKCSVTKEVRLNGKRKICIIMFIDILILFMLAGTDAIYNFLPTFCLEYLHWSVFSSATILSLFNIAAVFGGTVGIFLARVISPTRLMITAVIGWNISTISGFVATAFRVDWLIWLSVSLSGVFLVMIPPTATTWIQQNVCPITGKISASLTLAGGIGMASTPNIIGFTMQTITHMYFWYTQAGFAVLGCIAFGSAFMIQRFG